MSKLMLSFVKNPTGNTRKINFGLFVCLVFLSGSSCLYGQLKLDVEGDAKITGKLNVSSPGMGNLFIGEAAGDSITSGSKNTFLGHKAGNVNSSGNENTFIGNGAGMSHRTGFRNTFMGHEAGASTTFSFDNSFFGWKSGFSNTLGSGNTFIGEEAGAFNNIGNENTFIGKAAGVFNESGSSNTYIGLSAGRNNKSGTRNVFVGNNAGENNTKTIRSTFIGQSARQTTPTDSLSGSMALGYNSKVKCSKCASIGGTGIDAVKVGIGTDDPTRTLDVRGELFVYDTNGTAFFQSSGSNSFIRLENNNGAAGTSLGYFDNGVEKYFFIDTPDPDFGEVVVTDLGWMGIGDLTPETQLDVIGSIHYTGNLADVSDRRLKENLIPILDPLAKISQLNGFTYNLIGEVERSAGVIAQDVQKVLPEAVSAVDDGYLGVDYTQLVPLLIEGMKQQQAEIETLRNEVADLKKLVNAETP